MYVMCTYTYNVCFVIGFCSFSAPLGSLGLIMVWQFPKKCGNAAKLQCGKNTAGHLLFFFRA